MNDTVDFEEFLFADTSIFLECKPLVDIDFSQVLSGEVCIIVCPMVLRELDNHKSSSSRRKKDRASKALKRFSELPNRKVPSRLKEGLYLGFDPRDYNNFLEHNLNQSVNDDHLLLSAINFRQSNPHKKVRIFCKDEGLAIKAEFKDFEILKPTELWLLPEEKDDLQKENERLRSVVERFPKLEIEFHNSTNHLKHELFEYEISNSEKMIQAAMDILKKSYPFASELSVHSLMHARLGGRSVNSYNRELLEWFEKCEKVFRKQLDFRLDMQRIVPINLTLKNLGKSPASELRLKVHIPEGLKVSFLFPELPKIPPPPDTLSSFPSKGSSILALQSFYRKSLVIPDIHSPKWTQKDSVIEFNARSLQHQDFLELPTIILNFEKETIPKGFTLKTELIADEIPEIISIDLNIEIELQKEKFEFDLNFE